MAKTIIKLFGQEYELVRNKGVQHNCDLCALKWYCWDNGCSDPPCQDFTRNPEYFFVEAGKENEAKEAFLKKNLREKARTAYFSQNRREVYGFDIYAEGFKDGFRQALSDIKAIMQQQPNNLERIEYVINFINDYGYQRCEQTEEAAGDADCTADN